MPSGCAPSPCSSADGPLLPWLALAIGLAATGHFFWEALQLPLYTLWRTGTPREIAFALIHCTGGDILITTVTLAAAAALTRLFGWRAFGWRMVFTAIALGAAYTIFSEWLNVEIRRTWSYTAAMPLLPVLGTGLTPLLQWLIVPTLALAFIGCRYCPRSAWRTDGGRLHLNIAPCYAGSGTN
jgi:hypothetical protein